MGRIDPDALPPERPDAAGLAELGDLSWRNIGDPGGLTQFGAGIETLGPGARSSDRHWHEAEDEFVYVLSGTVTLVEDSGETTLGPGEAAAFPAGNPVGHCLENRGTAPARYLIVGTRAAADRVHYTTRDRLRSRDGETETLTRRDGSPLPPEEGA